MERLRTWIEEGGGSGTISEELGSCSKYPMVPPSMLLERLTWTRVGIDQNQPGT